MPHRKVVVNPYLMLALIEQTDRVRSDVSSAPNDQNAHSISCWCQSTQFLSNPGHSV